MRNIFLTAILIIFTAFSLPAIDVGGFLTLDYFGLIDPLTMYTNERVRITIAPEISDKNKENWFTFCLNGMFFYQPLGEPMIPDPVRIIREAYAGFHFGMIDIYLGQRFVQRGKVDVLSPLNVINHSDTTVLSMDNIYESTLPDLLGQVDIYFSDSFHVQTVYVPFLQPNIYSMEDILIEETSEYTIGSTTYVFDINAGFNYRQVPMFSEWAHSVHFSAHYTSDLFDGVISYSNYVDQFPDFDISGIEETVTVDGNTETHEITGTAYPGYNRMHNIGFGTSFYLFDFLVSADAALKLTKDIDGSLMNIRNNELFYVLQVERMFFGNLRAQVNFFNRIIFNPDAEIESGFSDVIEGQMVEIIDDYTLQKPPFQVYFLFHVDAHFLRETLYLGCNFIYGLEEKHAFYCAPRITYIINDYLSLFAGADFWWEGIPEGFLGRNEALDNFYIRAKFEI